MARLVGVALALVASLALSAALPSSLLSDSQTAHTKVKRSEEVLLAGNQQNKPVDADLQFQPVVRKRAAPQPEESLPTLPSADAGAGAPEADDDTPEQKSVPRRLSAHVLSNPDILKDIRKEVEAAEAGHGKTVAQYEKGYQYGVGKEALEKQAENSLLKTDIYGDPATTVNEYRYYGGGDARREERPSQRSARYAPVDTGSRLKRDLELDPESLLALISLWQAQKNGYGNYKNSPEWGSPSYGYERQEENNDVTEGEEEDDEGANSEWMEAPVAPTHYQYQDLANQYRQYPVQPYRYNGLVDSYPSMKRSVAGYYPDYQRYDQKRGAGQWGGFVQDKRFMVAKKRQLDRWDEPMLARLLASQPQESRMVAHRRIML